MPYKKAKHESTKKFLEAINKAGAVNISRDPLAQAKIPAETLSEMGKALEQNREALPVIEAAAKAEDAAKLANRSPGKITALADEAYKTAAKLGKAAKPFGKMMALLAGPAAGAIMTASDALASDDLGNAALEDAELEQAKKEAIAKRAPIEEQNRLADIKNKLADMASKPLSAEDVLTVLPPKEEDLGERETPDIENGDRLYAYEAERRKRQLGYK